MSDFNEPVISNDEVDKLIDFLSDNEDDNYNEPSSQKKLRTSSYQNGYENFNGFGNNISNDISKTLSFLNSFEDNCFNAQIESFNNNFNLFDVMSLIENFQKGDKHWKNMLSMLQFSKNCFANVPIIWYESFDLLKKQHEEILKNMTDFNSWVMLLQYSESLLRNQQIIKENKQDMALEVVRNSFDEFLKRYPYCYGYWKNYADIEKKLGYVGNVFKIYDRALAAFPNSVDLWIFYINFVIENSATETTNPFLQQVVVTEHNWSDHQIRELFLEATRKIGSEYKSEPFWDLFISWEIKHGTQKRVTKIYDLVLREWIAAYKTFFDRFKNHVETNDLPDILDQEDLDKFKRDIDLGVLAQKHNKTLRDDLNDELIIAVREKIIKSREEIAHVTENEVKKRKIYEDSIKRPYFHIKPLERYQLRNWNTYLNFEINQSPKLEEGEKAVQAKNTRVKLIFERCLVTATLYEEFWLKYARFLESIGDIVSMHKVFQRACFIHLPTKPNIFLTWAAIEEQLGNVKGSLFIFDILDKNVPDLIQLQMRRINLYRRIGDLETVENLYRANLTKYATNLCYYSYFVINLVRYYLKVKKDLPQAVKLLQEAIHHDRHNEKLYLQLLDIEYHAEPINIERILSIFDLALNSTLPDHSKTAFAQRKYEFLESVDTDVVSINKAREEFLTLLKQQLGGDFSSSNQKSYVKGNMSLLTHRQQLNAGAIMAAGGSVYAAQQAANIAAAQALSNSNITPSISTAKSPKDLVTNETARSTSSPKAPGPDHFNMYYQQLALTASLYYPMPNMPLGSVNPMFPYSIGPPTSTTLETVIKR